jgi:hypothetical protein
MSTPVSQTTPGHLAGTHSVHPWEARENPQAYGLLPSYGEHPAPRQHVLGIVGGNEVPYQGRAIQVDAESDLRGITRPNTFCPARQHQPADTRAGELAPRGIKQLTPIALATTPLTPAQMWAYPATLAPEAFAPQTCQQPEKF